MAKKTPVKAVSEKKVAPAKKAAPRKAAPGNVADACNSALIKLRELNLDPQLQGEIEWCLGSYAVDGNPVGLYQMIERALSDFKNLVAAQPKAVPVKLISELEKALKAK